MDREYLIYGFSKSVLQESPEKYSNGALLEKEEAFTNLERLRKKGMVDDDVELASYREEKYANY